MKKLFLILVFLCAFFQTHAQNENTSGIKQDTTKRYVIDSMTVYNFVNEMPTFKHPTYKTFDKYLSKNIHYPKDAVTLGRSGMVYAEFIIEKDGSVSNVKIVKGREFYPSCDQEVIRVISNSPKWNPGKLNGKVVRVKRVARFAFTIK